MRKKAPIRRATARRARPLMRKRDLRLLEGSALLTILVLIVGVFFVSIFQQFSLRSGQSAAVVSTVLVDLLNSDRANNGELGALIINPTLVAAAQAKADDMAAKGYFAHIAPDGKDSWYWFKQQGYQFTYAGENLAVDFSDSGDVEKAWMNSPTHRANLLDPHFTEIGIATASGMFEGHPTVFVVQMFGKPSSRFLATSAPIRSTSPSNPSQPALATTEPATTSVATTIETNPKTHVLGETVAPPVAKTPVRHVIAIQKPTVTPVVSTTENAPTTVAQQMPAPIPEAAPEPVKYAPTWGYIATSPKSMLLYAYYLIGLLILFALVITTRFELRKHHIRQFIVAGSLAMTMCVLFVFADQLLFLQPVLASTASALHQ